MVKGYKTSSIAPKPSHLPIHKNTIWNHIEPFFATATIKHHLAPKDNQPDHNLSDDFYVDNLITGADNLEEALQLYSKAKKLFLDMLMNLRDWNSNSNELNRKTTGQDRMKETITKVLGLQWAQS